MSADTAPSRRRCRMPLDLPCLQPGLPVFLRHAGGLRLLHDLHAGLGATMRGRRPGVLLHRLESAVRLLRRLSDSLEESIVIAVAMSVAPPPRVVRMSGSIDRCYLRT